MKIGWIKWAGTDKIIENKVFLFVLFYSRRDRSFNIWVEVFAIFIIQKISCWLKLIFILIQNIALTKIILLSFLWEFYLTTKFGCSNLLLIIINVDCHLKGWTHNHWRSLSWRWRDIHCPSAFFFECNNIVI